MDEVLNKALYDNLCKAFGTVAVYSRGEKATYTYDKGSIYNPSSGNIYAKNVTGGEHYAVTCPFCKRAGKLWISYLANSSTQENGQTIFFPKGLIICYRCHFNSDRDKMLSFWRMVGEGCTQLKSGEGVQEEPAEDIQRVIFPESIPIIDSGVPPRITNYLINRGMDLQDLNDIYHVCYSEDSKVLVRGVPRIIFPIIQNGEYVAWQGRCIDEDVARWHVAKYQFPTGVKIKWMLYNSDVARWQPYAILTEGITDVIACGKAGIASFGKTISQRQLSMLTAYWGNKGIIRIPDMDDPDAYVVAKKEVATWNAAGLFKDGAHIVIPPRGKDPGDLDRETIASIIKNQTGIIIEV